MQLKGEIQTTYSQVDPSAPATVSLRMIAEDGSTAFEAGPWNVSDQMVLTFGVVSVDATINADASYGPSDVPGSPATRTGKPSPQASAKASLGPTGNRPVSPHVNPPVIAPPVASPPKK